MLTLKKLLAIILIGLIGNIYCTTVPKTLFASLLLYGNGTYLLFTYPSKAFYSRNAINWSYLPTLSDMGIVGISSQSIFNNGKFVVICGDHQAHTANICYSMDGINWKIANINTEWENPNFSVVAYGNNTFLAGSSNGDVASYFSSFDGITWNKVSSINQMHPNLMYDSISKNFIAQSYNNYYKKSYKSSNGQIWSEISINQIGIQIAGDHYLATTNDYPFFLLSSLEMIDWTKISNAEININFFPPYLYNWNQKTLIMVHDDYHVLYSTDLINSQIVSLPLDNGEKILDMATTYDSFIISTTHNRLLRSTNARDWVEVYRSSATKLVYPQLLATNGTYIVFGLTEGNFSSKDNGKTWLKNTLPPISFN